MVNVHEIAEALGGSCRALGGPSGLVGQPFGSGERRHILISTIAPTTFKVVFGLLCLVMVNRQSTLLLVRYRYPYFVVFNSNVFAYDNPKYVYIYIYIYLYTSIICSYTCDICVLLADEWGLDAHHCAVKAFFQPPCLLQTTSINHICCDEFLIVATYV